MRVIAQPAFANRAGNPYQWLLYTHLQRQAVEVREFSSRDLLTGGYDVCHLHWPEAPLNDRSRVRALRRLARSIVLIEIARRRGTKIVWTVHNLAAHEERYPRLATWFWRAFLRRLDGFISLSEAGEAMALEKFPQLSNVPGFLSCIGHYREMYPDPVDGVSARTRLRIEPHARVVAFVGQIRPYKGVPTLCRAFRDLSSPDARLLIAGSVKNGEVASELERAARTDSRIRLHLGFVPDDDLRLYIGAADLVVLPFVSVLNSSSALLALSFDRPVLVPRTGPFSELQGRIGDEWLMMYDGDLDSRVLEDAILRARGPRRTHRPNLTDFDWEQIAAQTLASYELVAGVQPSARRARVTASQRRSPLVSVVIPVFNRPRAARRAVESALAQTWRDIEVIVVDDGSTDTTADSVAAISDPRVRLIRHDHRRGGSAARNTGIRASAGEYVAFLDSDDEWFPEKLQRQLDVFAVAPDRVALVYTGAELRYEDGGMRTVIPRHRGKLTLALLTTNVVGECSVGMVRRGVLDSIGGFDEMLPARQDVDLWLRISERFLIDFVSDPMVRIAKGADRGRITADVVGRLKARDLFRRKHEGTLRRERLLDVYLRESGWKYYRELGHVGGARACYWEAWALRPLALQSAAMLAVTLIPPAALNRAAWCKRRFLEWMRFESEPGIAPGPRRPEPIEKVET